MDILLKVYRDWQHNDDVQAIVVKGAGGKVQHCTPSHLGHALSCTLHTSPLPLCEQPGLCMASCILCVATKFEPCTCMAKQAFCAGGDVKATVQQIMRGEGEQAPRYTCTPVYTPTQCLP